MKQVTSMSRLSNQLEKMFRLLNQDFFDSALETPIITVIPTARAYAHYTPYEAWQSKGEGKREINIASGTLNRPLEAICSSLLHEMCHMYNDLVLNVQDCSRGGTYHSKVFKMAAESHGLVCTRTEKYGWSHTEPSDALLEWLLDHDELREIDICRLSPHAPFTPIGIHTGDGGATPTAITIRTDHHRKWICPCCGTRIRSTKIIRVICADCNEMFVET